MGANDAQPRPVPRRPGLAQLVAGGLARASSIIKKNIADLQRGANTPRAQTLDQILAAFEAAGIEFLGGNWPAVRLNPVRTRNA